MKFHKFSRLVFAIIVISCGQNLFAQNESSIRQEVIKQVAELKPQNTKKLRYKVVVPQKIQVLPDDLRLDLSYKIGHYEFQYVTLRFERDRTEPFVRVTKFSYGSALDFYKQYAKPDSYIVEQGKISNEVFDKLLTSATLLYQSSIEEECINPQTGCPGGSATRSWSSGNGAIIFNLADTKNPTKSIIIESGTLHAGGVKDQISNGYDDLRVHLFWQVFYDYLNKNPIFHQLDVATAEEIAISRLKEPQTITNYTDYFRLSAYIHILGNIGTSNAIAVLKKIAGKNSLEDDWSKYLSRNALEAVNKIETRANFPQ